MRQHAQRPNGPNGPSSDALFREERERIISATVAARNAMKERRGLHHAYCARFAVARKRAGTVDFPGRMALVHQYEETIDPFNWAIRRQIEIVHRSLGRLGGVDLTPPQREWVEKVQRNMLPALNRENLEYGVNWYLELCLDKDEG